MVNKKKDFNILCVSPGWIGDMIMALPALEVLRVSFPNSRIAVLTKPHLIPLWELAGAVDLILELDRGFRGTLHTVRRLREQRFDRVYILPNSFRSALIPFFARIRRRIGYRGHWRAMLLTETVERLDENARKYHQAFENIRLVESCFENVEFVNPALQIPENTARSVCAKLHFPSGPVGLIPGAARGPSKCWPMDHYIELGRRIADDGLPIAVFGSQGERELCQSIAAGVGPSATSYAGKTQLGEWAALMSRCRAIVSNDSGGMHLAAAVGVPLVAVFGITDPDKTGPLGEGCKVLQNSDYRNRDIPRNSLLARKSLESVTPEAVYRALSNF